MTDPSTMTVAQLKEALKTRGLDATGLKAALVARLRAALESSDADAEANDGASDPRSRPPLPNVNPPAREHRVGVRTRGGGGPRVRLLRDARTRITIDETPPLRPRRIIWPPGRGIRDRRRARPSGSRPAMPPPDGHVAARSRDTRKHVMSPSIASTHSWTRTDRPHPSIRFSADTPAADPTDEKATTPAKSDPPLAKAVSESIEKKKRKRGRGGEDAEAGDDADDAKDDEDDDGEKEAKAPRKDADAAAVPEIEMPPVTIDPNTGKASIEINVKGNEGRVIGKGGETIRHMERKFNCKIEMRRDRGTCLVTGPENVMRDAAEYIAQVIENGDVSKNERAVVTNTGYVGPETPASMIAKIVADARAKIDSGEDAAASDFPDVLKGSDVDEPVSIEVPCPGQEGRVIGRGGATIKEIERQSGAVAKVSKGTGRCDVNGPRGKVILARRIVLEVMALPTDPFAAQASQAGKREVGDWLCPQCGANVFRSKTACFSCGAPKPFEAYGMAQQPMGGAPGGGYAQQAPMGAPQMGYGMQQQQQGYGMPMGAPQPMMNMGVGGMGAYGGHGGGGAKAVIEVPCMGSEGRIIGKGGDMIKYIQTATNTKLDMKRDKGTVQVTGTPEAVAAAEAMVREVIENGEFTLILVWAISMTVCFVHRRYPREGRFVTPG